VGNQVVLAVGLILEIMQLQILAVVDRTVQAVLALLL
jgi:hypothetical protein